MEASSRPVSRVPVPPSAYPDGPSARATVLPFAPGLRAARPQEEPLCARLAVYDSETAPPVAYDVTGRDPGELLAELGGRAVWLLSRQPDPLPREAVLAVIENLIHADFQAAAVSVLADGSLRVSDQGPGIADKARALLPGFTTATPEMRRYIRGVGSGLPLARLLMERRGGCLLVEDNLARGTVVALLRHPSLAGRPPAPSPAPRLPRSRRPGGANLTPSLFGDPSPPLTDRQAQVLALLARRGALGPSSVSRSLGLSLSTAFRELTALEGLGLVVPDATGKRKLSPQGEALAGSLSGAGGHAGAERVSWK